MKNESAKDSGHYQDSASGHRFLNQGSGDAGVRPFRPSASFRQPLYAAHPVGDIAANPFVYAVTLCPHAGSKSTPWRRLAQAMRASLAASATMTTLRCARARSARSQAPSAVS